MSKRIDPFPAFNNQKCSRCGKYFIPGAEHIYKSRYPHKNTKYYCSWTCYLHSEDKKVKLK